VIRKVIKGAVGDGEEQVKSKDDPA
jgi:hypothetical protein